MSDISELFARDPLELSTADLDEIIAKMRQMRAAFNAGNMKGGATKPLTEKQKAAATLADTLKLDI
jgi:hypothetical protein